MFTHEASLKYCHLSRLGGWRVLKSPCLYLSPPWALLVPLIFLNYFMIFMCEHLACMIVCTSCMHSACGVRKRVLDLLGLQVQMTISHLVGAGD